MQTPYQPDDYRNPGTLFLYYGMRVLVLLASGILLWRGDYESALSTAVVIVLMTVPSFLKDRKLVQLPFVLDFSIVLFIFLTLFLGEIGRFYDKIPFWDKFLHFQSGLLLGASGYITVYLLNAHKKFTIDVSPSFLTLFSITFSLAIGVLWEVLEFAGDSILGSAWQRDNNDTMWDLIANGIGALIICFVVYFWMIRHRRLPFSPWLLRMLHKRKELLEKLKKLRKISKDGHDGRSIDQQ